MTIKWKKEIIFLKRQFIYFFLSPLLFLNSTQQSSNLQAPMAALQVPPFRALFLFSLFFFLLSIFGQNSAAAVPAKKIGNGYRLISVDEAPGGGILAFLQVNTETQIYGSDIPFLQLFVKYIEIHKSHFYLIFNFGFILVDFNHLLLLQARNRGSFESSYHRREEETMGSSVQFVAETEPSAAETGRHFPQEQHYHIGIFRVGAGFQLLRRPI